MTRSVTSPTLLDAECRLEQLPLEFRHALKFADAHNLIVLLGYVPDEGKAYLLTLPREVIE